MNQLEVRAGMELPHLPAKHRVAMLLRARLSTRQVDFSDLSHAHWPEEFFGLSRVRLFRDAAVSTQLAILENCGRALLEEAYFIEKAGVSFAAKMVLLGQTIEERMLYATFAGDEARHFDGVRSFVYGAPPKRSEQAFLSLLSDVIASGDRVTLQLVIQVLLEGWGLLHYRALRDGCQDPALRDLLDGILLDEAGHHGSGRVWFGEARLGASQLDRIEEVLAPLLEMVRYGPQSVLESLARALGGITRPQRICVLEQLDGPKQAQVRLDRLGHLLRFDSLQPLLDRLRSKGLFSPLHSEDCV